MADTLPFLPDEFHKSTISAIEQHNSLIGKSRFTVLKDVLPALVAFLWQASDNATAVVRLERDLEEFYQQSAKAERHLRDYS